MRSIVRAICISWIFYIRDLRSSQFRDLPMLSQWAKFQLPLFPIRTFPFTGNGVGLGPQWWPRRQFSSVTPPKVIWGHLRSPTVFLRITFDPREVETWEWSHCVSLIKTHRYICNMTYLGHHVTLTWGQILTLTFQGHAIHVSMRLDVANTMVSKSLLNHFKHGSYRRNTVSLKNDVFDISWPLTPKPLVLGEIWRHVS